MPEACDSSARINRRQLLVMGRSGAMATLGVAAAMSVSPLGAAASTDDEDPEGDRLGAVYQLQAAFHRAKTTQDIDLMMSLWANGASLTVQGDPNSPYTGADQLHAFWLSSGSFKNRRFSLVPSYKIQIRLDGHLAYLYFECHDVANYDKPTRSIVGDTFLAGTLRRQENRWLFWQMTAGKASPLSVDHYYFP